MQRSLLPLVACPASAGDLSLEAHEQEGEEILSRVIVCADCSKQYGIVRGVPTMNVEMQALENVARTFGYERKAHHEGAFEDETLFGQTEAEDWAFFLDVGKREQDIEGPSPWTPTTGRGASRA